MREEKPVIGLYRLQSGGYFVQDDYRLIKNKERRAVLVIETSIYQVYPELVDASFRLNKIFKFDGDQDKNIQLTKSYIEGRFSITLNPNESIEPLRYTEGNRKEGSLHALYRYYELNKLDELTQPILRIKGRFAHADYGMERSYDVEIRNAILTQDFPGAFFVMPIAESAYNFVATDASFERVTHNEENGEQR
jgi:hypothetical protein